MINNNVQFNIQLFFVITKHSKVSFKFYIPGRVRFKVLYAFYNDRCDVFTSNCFWEKLVFCREHSKPLLAAEPQRIT